MSTKKKTMIHNTFKMSWNALCNNPLSYGWLVHKLRLLVNGRCNIRFNERMILNVANKLPLSIGLDRFVPSSKERKELVDRGFCKSFVKNILNH